MLIPSAGSRRTCCFSSLSRRVNANSQLEPAVMVEGLKLIKKGEC